MSTQPPGSVKVDLQFPISVGGVEVKHLVVRRPKVRDRLNAERNAQGKSDAEQEVQLFSLLCEITADEIEQLDFADYQKIGETIQGFQPSRKLPT